MDLRAEKTIDSYNRIAKQYTKENSENNIWLEEFALFKKLIHGTRVLEVGCGGGRDAKLFLKNKFEYIGIDGSKSFLKVAKENNPKGNFRLMDFYDLDFNLKSFDGVWSVATLLHIPKRRILKILKKINKLLRKNGVAVFSVKEGKGEKLIHQEKYGGVDRLFSFYSKKEFTVLLFRAGFKILKTFRKKEDTNTWLSFVVKK